MTSPVSGSRRMLGIGLGFAQPLAALGFQGGDLTFHQPKALD